VPGHVKLTFTLDVARELAEKLSAQAIREGINMEAVILDILERECGNDGAGSNPTAGDFVIRVGELCELGCWGVMPSGLLRHP